MNAADLKLVQMIIDQPGFKIVEGEIEAKVKGLDHVSRITGIAFEDGKLAGAVAAMESMLYFIQELRKDIAEIKED